MVETFFHLTDRHGARPEKVERIFRQLAVYFSGLVNARRAAPCGDPLSRLLCDDGPDGSLRTSEIVGLAMLLLLAGQTSAILISNGMLALLRAPEMLERLRNDPVIAPTLVEELLRYDAPAHFISRGALADIDVGGVCIPQGSSVHLVLASANRDPRRFPNPDLFDPGRRDNRHLGFGMGIHACFGAPLARLQCQVALSELARRLVAPRLLQDPPPYRFTSGARSPYELRVAIERATD
jgi:cytochrome P450